MKRYNAKYNIEPKPLETGIHSVTPPPPPPPSFPYPPFSHPRVMTNFCLAYIELTALLGISH